jgi:cobalamin biosynthesis Co2+ chelatase CbiK
MRLVIEVEGEEVEELIEEFKSFQSKLDRLDLDVRVLSDINEELIVWKEQMKELVDANKKV